MFSYLAAQNFLKLHFKVTLYGWLGRDSSIIRLKYRHFRVKKKYFENLTSLHLFLAINFAIIPWRPNHSRQVIHYLNMLIHQVGNNRTIVSDNRMLMSLKIFSRDLRLHCVHAKKIARCVIHELRKWKTFLSEILSIQNLTGLHATAR